MNDTPQPTAHVTACLAEIFLNILHSKEHVTFEEFEDGAISAGHALIARALGLALERYDQEICNTLAPSHKIHDRRERSLATEVGDVAFSYRRVRDEYGCRVIPLADALDLPWGCRISPGASSFLVAAGAEVSYAKAARLLARRGYCVSATTVMGAIRRG